MNDKIEKKCKNGETIKFSGSSLSLGLNNRLHIQELQRYF